MPTRITVPAIFFAAVLATALRGGENPDLKLYDGRELKGARIISIGQQGVTVIHQRGMETIPVDLIPLDILARANDRLEARTKERSRFEERLKEQENARGESANAGQGTRRKTRDGEPALVATGEEGPSQLLENACVVMSNAGGTGTGFILRQRDRFVLISNQHVIDGAAPHRIEMADGKVLNPLDGILAKDRDLVAFNLAEEFSTYFEMEPDLTKVALGEDVVIYGNSLGRGVRVSRAKLLAKGPKQLEVSGGIVSGNSGGPILRAKTGKVIGVSTFVTVRTGTPRSIREIVAASTLPKVQYYGVRIDSLREFSDFSLRGFLAEAEMLNAAEDRLRRALTLLVLVAARFGERPSGRMAELAAGADSGIGQVVNSLQYSTFYPGTIDKVQFNFFRRRADPFFDPIGATATFIHAARREQLEERRSVLAELYRDVLRTIPVK